MADLTELSVVIDACSLYPMYLRDTLLRAAEARLYRVYWSEQILEELRRNLVCNGQWTRHGHCVFFRKCGGTFLTR